MSIGRNDVIQISTLAGIRLDEEMKRRFAAQLNEVLNYMEILKEVDTEGIEPTYHPLTELGHLREDEVGASLSTEASLENAPKRSEAFFVVPRVI